MEKNSHATQSGRHRHYAGAEYWHIVGDSHVSSFRYAAARRFIARKCLFTAVPGATAVGLRNPKTKTNAIEIFRQALLPMSSIKTPVIQLGEVDCGFVVWYRAAKHRETVESQVDRSIEAYFDFVDTLLAGGYPMVVITGATMPTIRDGVDWGDVADARKEVNATLRERTALTLDYNARLRKSALERRQPFIDIASTVIDPEHGVISDEFRHPDPTDHHLHPEKAGTLWANALNGLMEN